MPNIKSCFKTCAICYVLSATCYLLLLCLPVQAQSMLNSEFKIEKNNINPYIKDSKNIVSDSAEILKSNPEDYLILSISNTLIDYGKLLATNPITRTNTLSIVSANPNGFFVVAFEDNKLYDKSSNSDIPDTTCDSGTCSDSIPGTWDNPLTYGFGYRCDSDSKLKLCYDFSDTKYFKQFTNISKKQKPQIIIEKHEQGKIKSQVTYKVNISNTQPNGFYSNNITFLAIPNF